MSSPLRHAVSVTGAAPPTAPASEAGRDGWRSEVRVAIVGGGFAGVGAAIGLREAGIEDFVLLEKADELGGTWRDNTYPGCACDIPSYFYSFSFEQNPRWTRMFAPWDEILAYLKHCAEKYGIADKIRYGAEVTDAAFDESTGRWTVTINGDETL